MQTMQDEIIDAVGDEVQSYAEEYANRYLALKGHLNKLKGPIQQLMKYSDAKIPGT